MGKSFFRCRGARRSQSADRKCRGAHVGARFCLVARKFFIFRTLATCEPLRKTDVPATCDWRPANQTYVCNRTGLML